MGLISRMPIFVEQREKQAQHLIIITTFCKAFSWNSTLQCEEKVGVTRERNYVFESQDSAHPRQYSENSLSSSKLAEQTWNSDSSSTNVCHIEQYQEITETKNSSKIENELSKQFRQINFKSLMEKRDWEFYTTEDENQLTKMTDNWKISGEFSCRLTKHSSH